MACGVTLPEAARYGKHASGRNRDDDMGHMIRLCSDHGPGVAGITVRAASFLTTGLSSCGDR